MFAYGIKRILSLQPEWHPYLKMPRSGMKELPVPYIVLQPNGADSAA